MPVGVTLNIDHAGESDKEDIQVELEPEFLMEMLELNENVAESEDVHELKSMQVRFSLEPFLSIFWALRETLS